MATHTRVSLVRVWVVTAVVFVVAALASHSLTTLPSPMPAYWVGDIGLLAVAVALVLTWRSLGEGDAHSTTTRRVLRGAVVVGALLWLFAMIFPFL